MAQGTKHRRQAGLLGEIGPSFYLPGLRSLILNRELVRIRDSSGNDSGTRSIHAWKPDI